MLNSFEEGKRRAELSIYRTTDKRVVRIAREVRTNVSRETFAPSSEAQA